MRISSFLWPLPFLCFFVTYFLLHHRYYKPLIIVPSFIGLSLLDALKISSNNALNLKIIAEQEKSDVEPGTILQQTPPPQRSLKKNQTIFITIAKQKDSLIAPSLHNKTADSIKQSTNQDYSYTIHMLESDYPTNACFAQYPSAGQCTNNEAIIAYCAQKQNQFVIMPSLLHHSVNDVMQFLKLHTITVQIFHNVAIDAHHDCSAHHCIITDQQPRAGTIINLNHPPIMQLEVTY